MKELTTVPIKMLKEYVIKGWNSSSHSIINLYETVGRKAALGNLMALAASQVRAEKKYKFKPSYLAYHSDELLTIMEKLLNARPRVNT